MKKINDIVKGMSNMTQSLVLGVMSAITSFAIMVGVVEAQNVVQEGINILEVYTVPFLMSIIAGFITFFAWWLGKVTAEKVGYNLSIKMTKKEVYTNVIIGAVLGVITIGLTEMFYPIVYEESFMLVLDGLVFTLYGFFEEVLFRLGLIGLLSYSVYKVVYKEKEIKMHRSRLIGVIWVVLFLILSTMSDLNIFIGLENSQIIVAIILKLLPTIVFSWLFYKKGFFHSVMAHASMEIVINFILIPIAIIV